jgi:hypothetical protein
MNKSNGELNTMQGCKERKNTKGVQMIYTQIPTK